LAREEGAGALIAGPLRKGFDERESSKGLRPMEMVHRRLMYQWGEDGLRSVVIEPRGSSECYRAGSARKRKRTPDENVRGRCCLLESPQVQPARREFRRDFAGPPDILTLRREVSCDCAGDRRSGRLTSEDSGNSKRRIQGRYHPPPQKRRTQTTKRNTRR